ncbi:cysteine peptidase family C39 domain-containing protein [Candidatus Methanoplasma termitum]
MKFPHIQQHDSSDCGAACIASICSFYGREITKSVSRTTNKKSEKD